MHPMTHSTPKDHTFKISHVIWALWICIALLGLVGCERNVVRESGVHADNTPAFVREYVVTGEGVKLAHGSHKTWYADGSRRSLEFYEYGARQGYAFLWDQSGALISLRACEVGVCEDRAVPLRDRASGTLLADNRQP